MKKIIWFLALYSMYTTVHAQKKSKHVQEQVSIHKSIFKNALKYNDANTAIYSLHEIIVLEGKQSTYKDSLVFVYFKSGRYQSSHLLAKELLQNKPKDEQILEVNALSLQHLGLYKEAIANYEVLFEKTLRMEHGYQLTQLQYRMKRFDEAKKTIIKTLLCKDPEAAVFLQFPIDNNKNQNVPLKSAAYNLQGLISFELGDKQNALSAFKKALKILPEFAMATQNYNALIVGNNKKQGTK